MRGGFSVVRRRPAIIAMNDAQRQEAQRLQEAAFDTLHALLSTANASETINATMVRVPSAVRLCVS